MVGLIKRSAPAYVQLKQFMHEPGFGDPLSLHGMFAIGSRPGWDDEWFIKTGGVHYVGLWRDLFRGVDQVRRFGHTRGDQVAQCFSLLFEHGEISGLVVRRAPGLASPH